jgi:competence protein ComEA
MLLAAARERFCMKTSSNNPESPQDWFLLRRVDQAAIAVLTLAALVVIAIYWLALGGAQGRLIEIDRVTRESARFEIDLNEADWPEFSQLPGVGETLARRIVESRRAEGPFTDVEDLRRVRGIGAKTLERIRPYLAPRPQQANMAAQDQ